MEFSAGLYIFWGLTVLKLSLSFPLQARAAKAGTTDAGRLAGSQRRDDWLACAFLWLALITESPKFYLLTMDTNGHALSAIGVALSVLVYYIGSMAQMWLIRRTLQRYGILRAPGL